MNIKIVGWVCGIILVFVIGFVLGRSGIETPLNTVVDDTTTMLKQSSVEKSPQDGTSTGVQNGESVGGDTSTGSGLSSGQKKILETFGLNPDEATLTPEMISCAEAKVGKVRVAEILAGATPSMMEGASLVVCYK